MRSILQRTIAWLCLALALLAGSIPARGFVLCLEPDGQVCVDLTVACGACSGCEDHGEVQPASSRDVATTPDTCCACLDLPIPGSAQYQLVQPKSIDFPAGPWIACVAQTRVPEFIPRARIVGGTQRAVPRPPGSLILIESVVLLV